MLWYGRSNAGRLLHSPIRRVTGVGVPNYVERAARMARVAYTVAVTR